MVKVAIIHDWTNATRNEGNEKDNEEIDRKK